MIFENFDRIQTGSSWNLDWLSHCSSMNTVCSLLKSNNKEHNSCIRFKALLLIRIKSIILLDK